jgi:hypothetical protein
MSHSDDDIDRRNASDLRQAAFRYGEHRRFPLDLDALIARAERIEEQLAFVAYCGNGHRYSDHEWTAIERALAPIDAEPP